MNYIQYCENPNGLQVSEEPNQRYGYKRVVTHVCILIFYDSVWCSAGVHDTTVQTKTTRLLLSLLLLTIMYYAMIYNCIKL